MRTDAVAATYTENLRRKFAENVFRNAGLRSRGLSPTYNVYDIFYVFQNTLLENELYSTLTETERDSLIDKLIEESL